MSRIITRIVSLPWRRMLTSSQNLSQYRRLSSVSVVNHWEHLTSSTDFLSASTDDLIGWLAKDEFKVSNELSVLEGVMKWVDFDQSNRRRYLNDLLTCIRVPYTHPHSEKIYANYCLQGFQEINTLLKREEEYRKLPLNLKLLHLHDNKIQPRKYDEGLITQSEVKVQPSSQSESPAEVKGQMRSSEGQILSHDYFYAADKNMMKGKTKLQYSNYHGNQIIAQHVINNGIGAIVMDTERDIWLMDYYGNHSKSSVKFGSSTEVGSSKICSLQVGNSVYFFQYQPDTLRLSSIYQYNIIKDEISSVPLPPNNYTCVSLTQAGGRIYATNGLEPFLMMYEPTSRRWSIAIKERPKHLLDSVTIAAMDETLYILTLEFWPQQTDGQIFSYNTLTGKRSVEFRDIVPLPSTVKKRNVLTAAMLTLNHELVIPEIMHYHSDTGSHGNTGKQSLLSAFHCFDPRKESVYIRTVPHIYPFEGQQFSTCWGFYCDI